MCSKTPAVAYYNRKIKITSRSQLIAEWNDAPITASERLFLTAILDGKCYKELAEIFHKSEARVYQWKRSLFEKLHRYDMSKLR